MSDLISIAAAVLAAQARGPRRYAPHPTAPTEEEISEERMGGRSLEQWCEDEQGYHGDRRP